jgi:hypothetical protein
MLMSKMMRILVMCTLVLLALPLAAKDWFTFRFNPDYTIKYPSNWELTDREARDFYIEVNELSANGDYPTIRVKSYQLSKEQVEFGWQDFVDLQVARHKEYLSDNFIEHYSLSEIDTLAVDGADMGFHLRTDYENEEDPGIGYFDYALKGQTLYIMRFYCPEVFLEKYLSDYYVIRDGFDLK